MQKRSIQRGRPKGATTYDVESAQAFGAVVREARTEQGMAQEALASKAGIERSHMGKIERGEHMPTLVLVLKIARALGVSSAKLLTATEARLPSNWQGAVEGE
ncbi:MAG: helix-turn-helix transcriptional regulator [Nevskia sp.]